MAFPMAFSMIFVASHGAEVLKSDINDWPLWKIIGRTTKHHRIRSKPDHRKFQIEAQKGLRSSPSAL